MAGDTEIKVHPLRQEAGYKLPVRGPHVSVNLHGYPGFTTGTIRKRPSGSMTSPGVAGCRGNEVQFPTELTQELVVLEPAGRSQGLTSSMAEWREHGLSHQQMWI